MITSLFQSISVDGRNLESEFFPRGFGIGIRHNFCLHRGDCHHFSLRTSPAIGIRTTDDFGQRVLRFRFGRSFRSKRHQPKATIFHARASNYIGMFYGSMNRPFERLRSQGEVFRNLRQMYLLLSVVHPPL